METLESIDLGGVELFLQTDTKCTMLSRVFEMLKCSPGIEGLCCPQLDLAHAEEAADQCQNCQRIPAIGASAELTDHFFDRGAFSAVLISLNVGQDFLLGFRQRLLTTGEQIILLQHGL